jgi:hypothetical protein
MTDGEKIRHAITALERVERLRLEGSLNRGEARAAALCALHILRGERTTPPGRGER